MRVPIGILCLNFAFKALMFTTILATTTNSESEVDPWCELGIDRCDREHSECYNSEDGSYGCRCLEGDEHIGFGGDRCQDLNECSDENRDLMAPSCPDFAAYNCTNIPGSFLCSCNQGYSRNLDGICEDVDECAEGLHDCQWPGYCEDGLVPPGGYSCQCLQLAINARLRDKYDKRSCIDVNECFNRKLNTCDKDAICTNNFGSFECSCKTGWVGSGVECEEENECLNRSPPVCASNFSLCTNTVGSFFCHCKPGFQFVNNRICEDIDECEQQPGRCGERGACYNVPSSFACLCLPGWTFDGHDCYEV